MVALPIDTHLPQIVEHARHSRALVLVAEPGAGKTTRVPPALLRAGVLSTEHPNIVVLQPRRVAARAAAARIAEENDWQVGREVGYHVRFDRVIGRDTRLRVMTEGILTRQLLDDPLLEGVGCVILDEFHERSIYTDVAAALLKEVREARPDLILIVMSATLDAQPVSTFLGDCPVMNVEGRTFPVEVLYSQPSTQPLPDRVAQSVEEALANEGDILCFLPGVEEIRRTIRLLEPTASRENLLVLPLHGTLSPQEQARALARADQKKIVIATNIAETSLTIDGVRTVIDGGVARVAGYDAQRGLDQLELKRISKASAAQRAGRAGRTAPGTCVRLWTAREQHDLPDYELPEIRRVDLASTVLQLHAWGKPDPRKFSWYEPPEEAALVTAERLLFMLGALDAAANGRITPRGHRMVSLPLHPRLARLIIDSTDAGCSGDGATVAALLSEKDVLLPDRSVPGHLRRATVRAESDLPVRIEMLHRAEAASFAPYLRDEGIDPDASRQVCRTRDELLRSIGRASKSRSGAVAASDESLLRLALSAYPDRVCRRRSPETATMVGGGGVRLAAESAVRTPEYFVALDVRTDDRSNSREPLVRIASGIEPEWLGELFAASVSRRSEAIYDAEKQRVVGVIRTQYRDLVLEECPTGTIDPREASRVLFSALRQRAREFVENEPAAAALAARVGLLARHMPEHPWPPVEPSAVVEAACEGKRTVEDVKRGLVVAMQAQLPYPLDRLLNQHAPVAIEVPTGNRIRIEYSMTQPPTLAVRLQELFGLLDTPRVAAGRVPVVLHLLAPNYRPVQVTTDLRSFWTNTYQQVRKDLRARYPKHSWPEDPFTAKPEAKGRSRR